MAKVTWLGQGEHGPNQTTQWNTVFNKNEAVDVDDPSIVVRAEDDPFFKVEKDEPKEKKPEPKQESKPAVEPFSSKPTTAKK